jgi:NAD(P)-dependent dehydrogenase (short-subunit alcohol dehydrogenase family)
MTDKKVWFITGAGRGMGVDIAKAALAAGNAVPRPHFTRERSLVQSKCAHPLRSLDG